MRGSLRAWSEKFAGEQCYIKLLFSKEVFIDGEWKQANLNAIRNPMIFHQGFKDADPETRHGDVLKVAGADADTAPVSCPKAAGLFAFTAHGFQLLFPRLDGPAFTTESENAGEGSVSFTLSTNTCRLTVSVEKGIRLNGKWKRLDIWKAAKP
jgi:hypothetical protein